MKSRDLGPPFGGGEEKRRARGVTSQKWNEMLGHIENLITRAFDGGNGGTDDLGVLLDLMLWVVAVMDDWGP
jgi:hypothetical protein